jgi:hypothetical protein
MKTVFVTRLQFRSAVQKSLVDDDLGENVLDDMSDSGSEIDWEAEERMADLEESGSREVLGSHVLYLPGVATDISLDFKSPRTVQANARQQRSWKQGHGRLKTEG